MAAPELRPNASRPSSSTAKLRLLLRTLGKGCAGSRPIGVSTGSSSRKKYSRIHSFWAAVQSARRRKADAFPGQLGQQHLVQQPVLRLDERTHAGDDQRVDLRGILAVGPGLVDVELDLLLQARHADLDELVEVGRNDTQEPQPLQQRHALVRRLGQHAPVELEEAELAVEEVGVGRGTLHVRSSGKGAV